MDMGAIGGFNGFVNNNIGEKAHMPIRHDEKSALLPKDGLEVGGFSGDDIKDPRLAFRDGEVKSEGFRFSGAEESHGDKTGLFNDAGTVVMDEAVDIEGFYMSRMGQSGGQSLFGDFPLNGPGSSHITSLSGDSYNGNNPTFLRME